MSLLMYPLKFGMSLSARRAWIEIGNSCTQAVPLKVALRKESVDRNIRVNKTQRAPSVDRNMKSIEKRDRAVVALRKESVDRNFDIRYTTSTHPRSLSARRAWREIG